MELPELPATYKVGKFRYVIGLFILIVVLFVGTLMIRDGLRLGYFVAIGSTVFIVLFACILWPGNMSVTLTEDGLKITDLFRVRQFLWGDISEFCMTKSSRDEHIGFNTTEFYKQLDPNKKNVQRQPDGELDFLLFDYYRVKNEELLYILKTYHKQFTDA